MPAELRLQMSEIGLPMDRQPLNLQFGQLNNSEHLAAGDKERPVGRAGDRERAPEPAPLEFLKFAVDHQSVPEPGRAAIVNFSSHDNGAIASIQHLVKWIAEFFGEQRSIRFDKAQVSNIVHKASGVGIEEHDAHFRF